MIEQARHNVPSVEFTLADCRQLERLNLMFDAATYSFGLSYLNDSDTLLFFKSLNKVLCPSAELYLSTVTGVRSMSGLEISSSGDPIFMEYRSAQEVVEMVTEAGWEVVFQELLPSPTNAHRSTQDLVIIASRMKAPGA